MIKYKAVMAAMLAGLMFIGLTSCEKEGPAEKAGEAIDEAASDVANEASEVTESIKKKADE